MENNFDILIKQAMKYVGSIELKEYENTEDLKKPISKRMKININRLIRLSGNDKIIYPEVDNIFERIRSRKIRILRKP